MSSVARDPRAQALARYFRQRAEAFSLSADTADTQHVALAGMALLDAAALAENLRADDDRLARLSEAGCFEALPDDRVEFLETPALRAVVQRPLVGAPMSGRAILALLVRASV